MAEKLFEVTLHDSQYTRGWMDYDKGERTNTSILEVSATSADAAKKFAEQQNPGLEATEAKELK